MIGRVEVSLKPAETPVKALQQGPATFNPPATRDPVLGILIAVVLSALIWPALLVIWLYVWR